MNDTWDADVVVVGAGPAGCAAAITLRRAGIGVVLVAGPRRSGADAYRPGEGAPPGVDTTVRQVFGADVGAFDPGVHLRSYATHSAWGSAELATVDHMFNPFGPGWILDRAAFDARLLAAVEQAGVRVLHDMTVTQSRYDGGWQLDLASRAGTAMGRVTAGFVCDASGRRAVVARAHGARIEHHDRLTAVACTVAREDEQAPSILIEAEPDGWWYTAPLPSGQRVVTFFTDSDVVDVTRLLDAPAFAARARDTEHVAITTDEIVSRPRILPAGTRRLASPVGQHWLAVGDAAATFDPLSSQGILTALLTGREAGRACLAGDPASSEYAACLGRAVATYDREHADYYDAEARWPARPFWSRRRARDAARLQAAVTS